MLIDPSLFNPATPKEFTMDGALVTKALEKYGGSSILERTKVALFKSFLDETDKQRLVQEAARIQVKILSEPKVPIREMRLDVLVDRLTRAAFVRAALAESVEIKDGRFVIHDAAPKLGSTASFPERPQV